MQPYFGLKWNFLSVFSQISKKAQTNIFQKKTESFFKLFDKSTEMKDQFYGNLFICSQHNANENDFFAMGFLA